MPLIHLASNKARQENIKRELEAHPNMDPKQAVAIGYSVQNHARRDEHQERIIEGHAHEKLKYGQ